MSEDPTSPAEDVDGRPGAEDHSSVLTPDEGIEWTTSPPPGRRQRGWLAPSVVAVLVITSTALLAGLVHFWYLPDQKVGDGAATAAVTAASASTVAVLSYSPEELDKDFAAARSHLTGEFLTYYSKFTEQMVGPAARQKAIKTTASIAQAALTEIHPDSAVVLVYVNQSTQSAERPDPSITASSVLVSLQRVDDAWLVSAFNPI